jgi:hypothetical protein
MKTSDPMGRANLDVQIEEFFYKHQNDLRCD